MDKEKTTGLVETFDTGELSTALIPPDFTDPDVLFRVLLKTVSNYHPSSDLDIITRAYELAKDAHKGQKRKSGEPYLIHPVCVAIILAQLEMDKETIVGGLLHDVVEDTKYTTEDLTELFSEEIAALVDGVTKLTQLNYSADKIELQAENLRKMFLAMAKDIRVIIIKLADRLHNMRTLGFMTPEKQKEKSRETMDIYAPIAERLGISKVKVELDDLSLQYLEPESYKELGERFNAIKDSKETFVKDIMEEVETKLKENNIKATIDGRVKHLFSIYRKMVNQNKSLDQIYDLFAIRIIVDTDQECYTALGIIHEMYKPIPGRFKDYIAMPKANMYQSLHTTLIGASGQPFEIQIRTYEMHKAAEYGIAAHWKYKEASDGKKVETQEEEKLVWLRQILEWQQDLSDNKEFLNLLKDDLNLFADNVYCFTPTGDVKSLPAGSTPIDFAYSVHSAVGNKMIGARVNGKLVNIDYEIKNGDRVEIMTSQNSKGPSRDWLNVVKSTQAKNKINQWFKNELKEDNIVKGRELIHAYCKAKAINAADVLTPQYEEAVIKKYGFQNWESVLAAVGHGALKEGQIVNRMQELYEKDHRREMTDAEVMAEIEDNIQINRTRPGRAQSAIVVKGIHDVAVRFSKCCSPVPGDEIVGFVTRGRGISIHRTDCVNLLNLPEIDRNRLIDAEWQVTEAAGDGEKYLAEINIYANNRNGLLADVSRALTEKGIDILALNTRVNKQGTATIMISFEISGREELRHIVDKLRTIESIIDIERTTG